MYHTCLTLQVALVELQTLVLPSIESLKSRLEQRYTLERGPTPLERLDFITNISRSELTAWPTAKAALLLEAV